MEAKMMRRSGGGCKPLVEALSAQLVKLEESNEGLAAVAQLAGAVAAVSARMEGRLQLLEGAAGGLLAEGIQTALAADSGCEAEEFVFKTDGKEGGEEEPSPPPCLSLSIEALLALHALYAPSGDGVSLGGLPLSPGVAAAIVAALQPPQGSAHEASLRLAMVAASAVSAAATLDASAQQLAALQCGQVLLQTALVRFPGSLALRKEALIGLGRLLSKGGDAVDGEMLSELHEAGILHLAVDVLEAEGETEEVPLVSALELVGALAGLPAAQVQCSALLPKLMQAAAACDSNVLVASASARAMGAGAAAEWAAVEAGLESDPLY